MKYDYPFDESRIYKSLHSLDSPIHEGRSWMNSIFTDQELAAMSFINELDECYDDGMQVLPERVYDELNKCMDILNHIQNKNKQVQIHINRGSYLLNHMTITTCKETT